MADDWNAPKWAKEAKEDKEWERTSSGMEGSDCRRRADRGGKVVLEDGRDRVAW